jgi:glycerol-3-phosphate acyltransferase PlsY
MPVSEIIALVLGYLLGSIPTAYMVTRLVKGKDIRQLGGSNVGTFNVFREVGLWPSLVVAIVDLGKGAAAIAIAHYFLQVSPLFVLLSGLAAVIGHMWMAFLKFTGGKGAGTAIGALALVMPLYGYWYGLLIFLAIVALVLAITHNVSLSIGSALLFLPLITWLSSKSIVATIIAIVLGLAIGLKYLPTARRSWAKSGTTRDFIFERGRRDRDKPEEV